MPTWDDVTEEFITIFYNDLLDWINERGITLCRWSAMKHLTEKYQTVSGSILFAAVDRLNKEGIIDD